MSEQHTVEKEVALESVITTAVQIPGVKVNRRKFLSETFATENVAIQDILDLLVVDLPILPKVLCSI